MGHHVDLGIQVVDKRNDQCLERGRRDRRAEFALAVVGQDRVLEAQEQLAREPVDPGRGLANHVPAHQHVTDQGPFRRIPCLDRVIRKLAQLADVVQDRGRHDQTAIERRIELVVVLAVMIGQKHGDPGHAPDVLEQTRRVRVMHVLGGRHPQEERRFSSSTSRTSSLERRMVDRALDQPSSFLNRSSAETCSRDQVEEVVTVGRVGFGGRAGRKDVELKAEPYVVPALHVQSKGRSLDPGIGFLSNTGCRARAAIPPRRACRERHISDRACWICVTPRDLRTSAAKQTASWPSTRSESLLTTVPAVAILDRLSLDQVAGQNVHPRSSTTSGVLGLRLLTTGLYPIMTPETATIQLCGRVRVQKQGGEGSMTKTKNGHVPAAANLGKLVPGDSVRESLKGRWDVIVVGAGHNGLACAAYLARAGKSVLVLEARERVGGACTLHEVWPGHRISPCAYLAGLLHPKVIEELEMAEYGFRWTPADAGMFVPFDDGIERAALG